MVKILKNTTLSDIELNTIGLTIPASSQITIQVEDYLLLASEDSITEIIPLINNGDIIVNNGTDDLFAIKGINYIQYQDNYISANTIYISPNAISADADGTISHPFINLTQVKNALDAGNITTPIVIDCDGGDYIQDPVDFSGYTNITIKGSGPRTRFIANNSNADLLTLGASQSLRSVSFEGVTNSNNYMVKFSGTGNGVGSIDDIFFTNGSNGFSVVNTTGVFRVTISSSLATNLTGSYFECNDNTVLTLNAIVGVGDLTNSKGFIQNGSGELFVFTARLTNYNIAVEINGDTGFNSFVGLISVNSNIVLDQNGSSDLEILGGNFDASTASLTDVSVVEGYFFNKLDNENQLRVISELSVGLPNKGAESVFGEGDSYTNGMLVYTETSNGVFTSVSSEARSFSSSTFSFPSTVVNSAIYISTAFDQANPIKWYGFKASVTQASVLPILGDIIFEYWNGSSWVEFNHMLVDSAAPFRATANEKFTSTGSKQIYFDSRLEQNWVVNDPISLGINLYWIRMRVDGVALTTSPIFEQFKIHTNRMEIDTNGFQLMYGTGRIKEKFPISLGGLLPNVGRNPNSQDFYLSDNLAVAGEGNSFPTNQNRSKIFTQFIPFELDTSSPVDLTISYYGDSSLAGTVQWEVIWATSNVNEGVYSSTALAPSVSENERSIIVTDSIPVLSNNMDRILSFRLEIPEALAQQTNGDPQSKIWIRLTRDESGVDDYVGNIILTDFTVFYTAWREGGYVGEF